MHEDRGAYGIALPLLAGTVVTAIVATAMLASSTPWLIAADTGNGFLGQTVPAYRAWMSGRIPEWTDLLWGGYPLIGDCSNAALYPPHMLAFLATHDAPLRFFDAAFALHLGILAAGSAYLTAVLGGTRRAQAFAAACAALCPFPHYCAMIFFPVFAAQSWWPWALAAAERLARPSTPALGGAMVLGWVALAAQVLAGMPEQATYGALVAAAWLLTRRAGLTPSARILRLALLGAGALALAAPQLFPTIAYVTITERASRMEHVVSGLAALSIDDAARLLFTRLGDAPDIPSFFGVVVPALALVGIALRRPGAALLGVVALTAFLYAAGSALPVYGILHRVPPLDHFRAPIKLEALVELALVWGAALGLDAALRAGPPARVLALIAIALALGERAAYLPGELAAFRTLIARTGVPLAIVDELAASPHLRAHPPLAPSPLVFDFAGPYGGGYARSIGALVGVASLRPYPVSLMSRAHLALFSSRPNRAGLLLKLGVRYVLVETRNCDKFARGSRWAIVEEREHFCLLENPKVTDRYQFLAHARSAKDEAEMIDALRTQPDQPVPVVAPPEAVATLGVGLLLPTASAPGVAELRTLTAQPALVLVRQSASPGWDVRVDDHPVTPYPADGIYFAVPVGRGTHQISLTYRTPGFRLGVGVAAAWTIVMATLAAVGRRRRRAASALATARAA